MSVEKLTSVYSTSRCPAILAHFDHGEGGRRKEPVFIAIGADLLACFILVVRAAVFDRVGLTAHVAMLALSLQSEQPSDEGAEKLARRALAVIEGRWHRCFYVSFAPRTSVSLGRACWAAEVGTGVGTRRAFPAPLTHMTDATMRFTCSHEPRALSDHIVRPQMGERMRARTSRRCVEGVMGTRT